MANVVVMGPDMYVHTPLKWDVETHTPAGSSCKNWTSRTSSFVCREMEMPLLSVISVAMVVRELGHFHGLKQCPGADQSVYMYMYTGPAHTMAYSAVPTQSLCISGCNSIP